MNPAPHEGKIVLPLANLSEQTNTKIFSTLIGKEFLERKEKKNLHQ